MNDILTPLFASKVSFMYLCGMDELKNIKGCQMLILLRLLASDLESIV